MPDEIKNLLEGDPIASSLIREAENAFESTKADRDLLKQIKSRAKRLGEEFLNTYLIYGLDDSTVNEVINALKEIRIVRKVRDTNSELQEIYKCLGIIHDYSSNAIELDYPQSLADSLMLRAFETDNIKVAADYQGIDAKPLLDILERTYRELDLSPERLSPGIVRRYNELSYPLLIPFKGINATKIYFLGPVFYENAGSKWTLTFATGSGLPDPLEWHGSSWYSNRYGIDYEAVKEKQIGDKNPFRALNFSLGICNPHWDCKRLYFWEQTKTAVQVQKAYTVAREAGKGELYLLDAIRQLIQVFTTPNLKIMSLYTFPEPLRTWTRISPKDIMLSCRPEQVEARIAYGLWFRPSLRIGDEATRAIQTLVTSVLSAGASMIPHFGPLLAALAAGASVMYFEKVRAQPKRKQVSTIKILQRDVKKVLELIWND